MNTKIVLITKEVLRADYLPVYGNNYWKTPNIDLLAEHGTVFRNHFTNAPSTAMAITCMFTGLYAHQLGRKFYNEVDDFEGKRTIFDVLEEDKYKCHIMWTHGDYRDTYRYSKCFGHNTEFHNLDSDISNFYSEIEKINDSKYFLWIHLPGVISEKEQIGSDIDIFDNFIGFLIKIFGYDGIYLSADHGHMSLEKGVPLYGFHLYNGAIHVPLITPKINGADFVDYPTSHKQFYGIFLHNEVQKEKYIFSDTQYYLQSERKFAVIAGNYKYIYNKYSTAEELYDYNWDPSENYNLINSLFNRKIMEPYRKRTYDYKNMFFYPNSEILPEIYEDLKSKFKDNWKQGSVIGEYVRWLKTKIRHVRYLFVSDKKIVKGNYK